MTALHPLLFILTCGWVTVQPGHAAPPSPEALGRILGYPASELVVEDVTGQERALMQTPTRREEKRQTALPDPAILLQAYLIHGKIKNSFFPIHVFIGKKDALLTAAVAARLAEWEALPMKEKVSGTESFASIGLGGWYFATDFKVKSDRPQAVTADAVVANIIVVQPHGQDFDIKIAQRAGLDQGEALQLIPGGETYFNTFGPSSGPKSGPPLDDAKIFPELTRIVIAGWLATQSADGVGPPPPDHTAPTPSKNGGIPPRAEDRQVEPAPPQGPPGGFSFWGWLVGVALLILAAVVLRKRDS